MSGPAGCGCVFAVILMALAYGVVLTCCKLANRVILCKAVGHNPPAGRVCRSGEAVTK